MLKRETGNKGGGEQKEWRGGEGRGGEEEGKAEEKGGMRNEE